MNKGAKVALGMSGGVDSSVSAALLMRAGYQVVGITVHFRDSEKSALAEADAASVCKELGISHIVHSFTSTFERRVVSPFVSSYANGLTPSPCVSCNAGCKMPALLEVARAQGCEYIATGHYARIIQLEKTGRFAVHMAKDPKKDQSYMLCMLAQSQLERLMLPLGETTKVDVRILAAELGLSVAEKPESQDNCFVENDYRDLLFDRGVVSVPGDIIDRNNNILGKHNGLANYTVGQRKGIGIAGPEPYYVVEKRVAQNQLVVGFARDTLISGVGVGVMNWQACEALSEPFQAQVKLRYRSAPMDCTVTPCDKGLRVNLHTPQPTTAPGQYAAIYKADMLVGGGMIEEVF